jgi:hypothetical protein
MCPLCVVQHLTPLLAMFEMHTKVPEFHNLPPLGNASPEVIVAFFLLADWFWFLLSLSQLDVLHCLMTSLSPLRALGIRGDLSFSHPRTRMNPSEVHALRRFRCLARMPAQIFSHVWHDQASMHRALL